MEDSAQHSLNREAPRSPLPHAASTTSGHGLNSGQPSQDTVTSRVDAVEMWSSPLSVGAEGSGPVGAGSRREQCTIPCLACVRPFSRRHNPLPAHPTRMQLLRYAFLCPPHGLVGWWVTLVLISLFTFGSLVAILGPTALPGGNIFSLFVLFVVAVVAGQLVVPLSLPPLLGMLVAGILLSSVPGLSFIGNNIDKQWSASLRNVALVVILVRAGLGLDPAALRQLSLMVVRLAFTPCLVETLVVACVTHLLMGFPWLWGLMLGFVLGAVTPAVIVPCMLVLGEKGYGVAKGIPTLVIAASSIDDVLAISGFGVLLGITFAEGELWVIILKGPLEVVVGLVCGAVVGAAFWVLPDPRHPRAAMLRFCLLLTAALFCLFGSQMVELGGAGALGCLVMAFTAGYGWRKQEIGGAEEAVDKMLGQVWEFCQPLLFALIGAEIQVEQLDGQTVGYGLVTLAVGLVFRVLATFLVVLGGNLTVKERFFVALAWLPKATVQAAIGSQALDYARKTQAGEEAERLGVQVLTIAVLSILITAPLGAAAIMLSAPRLLSQPSQPSEHTNPLPPSDHSNPETTLADVKKDEV